MSEAAEWLSLECVCVCCVVLCCVRCIYPSLSLSLSPSARKGRLWVVERVVSPATLTAQERDELVEQLSKLQHIHTLSHSQYTNTHVCTHTHIHTHSHSQYTNTHARTHTYTHTLTHNTHQHTRAHAHTHCY